MKALSLFQYKRGMVKPILFFNGLAPKAVCAGKLRAGFWYAQKVLEGGRVSLWRVFRGSEGAFPEKKAPSLILSECFEESDLANGLHRGQRVGEGHEDVPRHQTPAVRRRLGLRAVGKREPRSRIRGDGLLRRQFLRFARGEGAAFAGILRRLQFLRQGGIGGRGSSSMEKPSTLRAAPFMSAEMARQPFPVRAASALSHEKRFFLSWGTGSPFLPHPAAISSRQHSIGVIHVFIALGLPIKVSIP